MTDKIVIIDGHSILNRAFYGVPVLNNSKGFPTNGIYGFFGIMMKILDEERPTHLAVAFDLAAPTFRHKMYSGYKGTRKPMPDDLHRQVPVLKDLLKACGIPVLSLPGYEADDILGTVSLLAEHKGMDVLLLSGDRDLFQLVSDKTCLCIPRTKGKTTVTEFFFEKEFTEAYGVTPREFIAMKALMGDTSDNIPGVAHIGEKTAGTLIRTYHDLDTLYAQLDDIKSAKTREYLENGRDNAYMSYQLAEICRTAPLEIDWEAAEYTSLYTEEAYRQMKELEIHSFMRRFPADLRARYAAAEAGQSSDSADNAGKSPAKHQRVYGLTGGVGSGKSTILDILKEEYGALILQADRIAEEVMMPGGASYDRVISCFGRGIVAEDGLIDRKKLSSIVFADPEKLEKLNAIVHPDTHEEVKRRIRTAEESLVVYEAALPKEARFEELCDAVIYVYATEEVRLERLFFGRGYSFDKSLGIMANQLKEDEFRMMADAVVDNNGSPEDAKEEVRRVMDELAKRG